MSVVPSDYIVNLQEVGHDIRVENDPETFLQALSSREYELWLNVVKDEIDSIATNGV